MFVPIFEHVNFRYKIKAHEVFILFTVKLRKVQPFLASCPCNEYPFIPHK